MEIEEIIKSCVVFEPTTTKKHGGQSCGLPITGFRAKSEDLGFEISISSCKSNLRNRDICETLTRILVQELKQNGFKY